MTPPRSQLHTIPCQDPDCPGRLQLVTLTARAQPLRFVKTGEVFQIGEAYAPHPPIVQAECDTCQTVVEDLTAWVVLLAAMEEPLRAYDLVVEATLVVDSAHG